MPTDPAEAELVHLWTEYADGLAAFASQSPAAPRLDTLWSHLRAGIAQCGAELLPRNWSFADPPSADDLRADGAEVVAVFRPDHPAGAVVRLKRSGILVGGDVLRRPVVVVSAGPAPVGLAELEEAVRDHPGPAAEAVRERLRDWRAAGLDGRLEAAAVELYVEYWDRLRGELPAEVGDRLAAVLAEEFGLTPFCPANFRDRPDGWVQPVGGGRMATGRVREVVRPGLADRVGELRVPARVVVE